MTRWTQDRTKPVDDGALPIEIHTPHVAETWDAALELDGRAPQQHHLEARRLLEHGL